MTLTIRKEQPDDIDGIYAVEKDAFERNDEADLVNKLRELDLIWLSYVALEDEQIVGHAAYTMVSVTDPEIVKAYPALGPIAVASTHQRQGVGAALMRVGLREARARGHGMMFVLGHPEYYTKFGFEPAKPLGFTSDYIEDDGAHEHFMVAIFDETLRGKVKGHVKYNEVFDGV